MAKFIWLFIRPAVEVVLGLLIGAYLISLLMLGYPGLWAFSSGHWVLGIIYFIPAATCIGCELWNHAMASWKDRKDFA